MLLLTALLAAAAWSYGFAQEIPVQSPRSITKSKGSVRLDCDLKGVHGDFHYITVHWYQQKPNDAPKRILYHTAAKVVDSGFQAHRYTVEKFPRQKLCILTIKDITPDDAATYYCAYWYRHCGRMSEITKTNTPSASQPQTTKEIPTHFSWYGGAAWPQAQEKQDMLGASCCLGSTSYQQQRF